MAAVFNIFSSFARSFTTLYWISASQSESEPELDHDFVRSFLFLKVYMFSDTLFYVHVRKQAFLKNCARMILTAKCVFLFVTTATIFSLKTEFEFKKWKRPMQNTKFGSTRSLGVQNYFVGLVGPTKHCSKRTSRSNMSWKRHLMMESCFFVSSLLVF